MKRDNLLYIEDIKNAIDWILNDFTYHLSQEKFINNRMIQDAVIREVAVIGEAMKKIDDDFLKKYPELPSRESVSMRNILVHDYDNIDLEKLWKTVQSDLPVLKEIAENILQKETHAKITA